MTKKRLKPWAANLFMYILATLIAMVFMIVMLGIISIVMFLIEKFWMVVAGILITCASVLTACWMSF